MDLVWQNLRYLMIAAGSVLSANVCNGCVTDPIIEQSVGAIIGIIGAVWGNYVKKGTKAVPIETALRPDVPTISAATGVVEPGKTFTK